MLENPMISRCENGPYVTDSDVAETVEAFEEFCVEFGIDYDLAKARAAAERLVDDLRESGVQPKPARIREILMDYGLRVPDEEAAGDAMVGDRFE